MHPRAAHRAYAEVEVEVEAAEHWRLKKLILQKSLIVILSFIAYLI
jgi:hypothetical protein